MERWDAALSFNVNQEEEDNVNQRRENASTLVNQGVRSQTPFCVRRGALTPKATPHLMHGS